MQTHATLRRPAARALGLAAALACAPLSAREVPSIPVSVAVHDATNAFIAFRLPPATEIAGDSLRARLEPDGPDLAFLGPPPPGTNELGAPAWTAPFVAVFSAPTAFSSNAVLAIRFQPCMEDICFPPQTVRLPVSDAAFAPQAPESGPSDPSPELPTLDDLNVVRTIAGAVSPEEYLAFLDADGAAPAAADAGLADLRRRGGLPLLLLGLLLAGVLLNLTPCVLPLVPVNLALLGAGLGRASRRRGAALGAAFGLGMALAYGALGLIASRTSAVFGALHASAPFNALVAGVFCVLALAMLDALRIDFSPLRNLLPRRRRAAARPRSGATAGGAPRLAPALLRAFAAGAGSALLAGACVAPALVAALMLSAQIGGLSGALLPFALGLGMGLPWPFLAAGLAALPKPGAWMRRVRQLFALVFVAAALWYLLRAFRILFPLVPEEPGENGIPWLTDEAAAVIASRSLQAPVLVELTADWCAACHEMERTTFSDPAVIEAANRYLVLLRVDCTDVDDPDVRRILARVGAPGLPFSAILAPPSQKP